MAKTYPITCVECGTDCEARRANAKRCPICRLRNDLLHVGTRTKPCVKCGDKFGFINKDEKLCPKCDRRVPHMDRGNCGLCHDPNSPFPIANLRLCVDCIHDTKQREAVLGLLRERIQWDQRQNGVAA